MGHIAPKKGYKMGGGGGVFLILSSKLTVQGIGAPLPKPTSPPCTEPDIAVQKAKVFDLITPYLTSKKIVVRLYILYIIGYPSKIIIFSESK